MRTLSERMGEVSVGLPLNPLRLVSHFMEYTYSNGGTKLEFYINKFEQVYMEVDGKWISIPYDEVIKIGQKLVEMGEELENRNNG